MNFAGWTFVGLFLPAVLAVHFAIRGPQTARLRQAWLIAASIVFYGVSGLDNLAILLASVSVNYAAGRLLAGEALSAPRARRALLWSTVGFNLALLSTFKIEALWARPHDGFLSAPEILIPLALSFITFQQIGFVVDCYRRRAQPLLFDYLFFVIFFPQLIMGPILRYGMIERQLRGGALARASLDGFAVGAAIFIFGLAKKLLLADVLGERVDPTFDLAAMGVAPTAGEAWFGVVAFPLQLFLDFSAYADMAIGLGRMMGIDLPINFDEPLKAVNRFDMWRRWHITFVIFMRAHVFVPLVRHVRLTPAWALWVTAFLAGLWHGLGWTFVIWAWAQAAILLALHWRKRRNSTDLAGPARVRAIAVTFAVTCLLAAMFRSPNLEAAGLLYAALAGLGGPGTPLLEVADAVALSAAAAVVWMLPDAQRLFERYWTAIDPRLEAIRPAPAFPVIGRLRFVLNARWGVVMSVLLVASLVRAGSAERFIYVQF